MIIKKYNNTINLPKINFPMKANLKFKELKIIKKWYKYKLYDLINKNNKNKKKFTIHDGPPYANGNIHIGHALNKILKDIILKFKNFENFNINFTPGWDCHGLPIELKIKKKIKYFNKDKFKIECKNYVKTQINNQKNDFLRLGIIANWKNHYETMNYNVISKTLKTLTYFLKLNILKRKKKPINWCLKCNSSLAEAEIEYFNKKTSSIYVYFILKNTIKFFKKNNIKIKKKYKIKLLIWTTTIWSIPGNCAIAIHPNLLYTAFETKKKNIIILLKNKKYLINKKYNKLKKIKTFLGKKIKNFFVYHPITNKTIPIIFDKNINKKTGTGIVHIASEHGQNDYILSKKYNLKGINVLNNNSKYINYTYIPKIKGCNLKKAKKLILSFLIKKKKICFIKKIKHKYPYCWRHKIPIVISSTYQWFINLKKIKKKLLKYIKKINWIPKWGYKKIKRMIITRDEWCISRQRYWGTPMTLLIHKKTQKTHPNMIKIINKIHLKIKKLGPGYWDNVKISKLTKKYKEYTKVTDVLDVWYDSGATNITTIKNKNYDINLLIEGSDQYRGWFLSSLIINVVINNKKPLCKKILTHGFVVDGKGMKMSKSMKNNISPNYIINNFGADILRLWVASTKYQNEINISKEILNRVTDSYRKIRNTIKFMISNLDNYNYKENFIKFKNMILIDQWIIFKAHKTQKKIIKLYKKFNFCRVTKSIINFCNNKLSSLYLNIIKDRKYIIKKNTLPYLSVQSTLWILSNIIVKWIAPILSFTAEEVWKYIYNNKKSIFIEKWWNKFPKKYNNIIKNNKIWKNLIKIKNKLNKIIEKKKNKKEIFSSLEIKAKIYINIDIFKKIKKFQKELKFFFIVSKLILKKNKNNKKILIKCSKYKGTKCTRCWNYTKNIINNKYYYNICQRCLENLNYKGEKRYYF